MTHRNILLTILLTLSCYFCNAQTKVLTLEDCRELAISNNKELKISGMEISVAENERKAAFTKYFPRISASGTFLYTSKEFSLLSDEQKNNLNTLGNRLSYALPQLSGYENTLNSIGAGLVEALHTDTRNAGAVGIMLTQPVYMGGKIRSYNKITQYAESVAHHNHNLERQNLIVQVDETYWLIVSLSKKKELAESYLRLVRKADSDVQALIKEGFTTKADGLSVKVKVNEAEVALLQVENGLSLAKMSLCQICGLEIDDTIIVEDEISENNTQDPVPLTAEVNEALSNRPEMNILNLSENIFREKIKLARSEFMPTVALTGGYIASNPSVFNSFERQFKGMWTAGIVVNIPLVTSGERFYKVRAAKTQAQIAALKIDETREKITLQVNQCLQKVQEASERLNTAHKSISEADENLRYATLGMKEGVIPVSNVLEAQTAWLKAHSTFVDSQIDLRLANLYLLKSTGLLK
ncbi:MAG: TolC family protein [Muribaculaceae bacterium]